MKKRAFTITELVVIVAIVFFLARFILGFFNFGILSGLPVEKETDFNTRLEILLYYLFTDVKDSFKVELLNNKMIVYRFSDYPQFTYSPSAVAKTKKIIYEINDDSIFRNKKLLLKGFKEAKFTRVGNYINFAVKYIYNVKILREKKQEIYINRQITLKPRFLQINSKNKGWFLSIEDDEY